MELKNGEGRGMTSAVLAKGKRHDLERERQRKKRELNLHTPPQ